MSERILRVPLPSGTLTLFDPELLAHRRGAEPGWAKDARELNAELNAFRLASIAAGAGTIEVRVPDGEAMAPPSSAQTAGVRIQSGKLFLADASELPSRAWGQKRWNLWDWLFAAFLISLLPFGLWLAGFDRTVLRVTLGVFVFFVLCCIPLTWLIFRHGNDFKRRSGVPPKDHPDRVLDLPPGDYVIAWEHTAKSDVPVVRLWFGVRRSG